MNVLTDIFLFYTRFTTPDGVARLFNKGTSTVPGYSQLQQQALAEAGKETPVKLDNYVFGANIDAVSSRINNLNGFYLFVDYGEIECNVNKTNCQTDSMRLGVTVAYRIKEFSGDLMEQLLVSDSCMDYLTQVYAQRSPVPHMAQEFFRETHLGSVCGTRPLQHRVDYDVQP